MASLAANHCFTVLKGEEHHHRKEAHREQRWRLHDILEDGTINYHGITGIFPLSRTRPALLSRDIYRISAWV